MSTPSLTHYALMIGFALALWGQRASADSQRDLARQHFDRAVALLKERNYAAALAELNAAHTVHPHPAVLYNIGMTHVAMGDAVAAARTLERYLEEAGPTVAEERRIEIRSVLDTLAGRIAKLELNIQPTGARIRVDGTDVGAAPLSAPLLVVAGRHELAVLHPGHQSETRSLDLRGRTTTALEIRLQVDPASTLERTRLDVDCSIPDATMYLDSVAIARTPISSVLIPLGTHRVEFRRAAYRPSRQSVAATRGTASLVRCQLIPSGQGQTGAIRLGVAAQGGRLWVDSLPARDGVWVPTGRHRVRLEAAGYEPWEGMVEVTSGKTTTVGGDLRRDVQTVRSAERQRTWAYALGAQGIGFGLLAGGLFLWNTDRYGDWRDRQDSLDGAWAQQPVSGGLVKQQTENDKLRESIQNFDRLSVGLGITGGVLFAAGTVLFLTGDDPSAAGAPLVAVSPSHAAARWSVRW